MKTLNKPIIEDSSFLQIDQSALDEEWLRQPSLYYEWASQLSDAKAKLDSAKADLELTRAELDLAIRGKPAEYGLEKVTESVIGSSVLLQQEYKEALSFFNKKKHRVDVINAVVSALDHKKKALENLVWLHGQNYFSAPQAPTNESREQLNESKKKKARSSSQLDRTRDDND